MTINLLVYGTTYNYPVASSITVTLTVPSDKLKMRVIAAGFIASSSVVNAPSLTFDGAAMTSRFFKRPGGGYTDYYGIFLWDLSNPSPGSKSCVCTYAANSLGGMTVAVFDNCADTTPASVAEAPGQNTVNVPAGTVGDLVMGVMGSTNDSPPSGATATWAFQSHALAGNNGWGSFGVSGMLAASTSQALTWTGNVDKNHVGISFPEVKPTGGPRVIMFLEKFRKEWAKQRGLYSDLMRQGAVPLGAQI